MSPWNPSHHPLAPYNIYTVACLVESDGGAIVLAESDLHTAQMASGKDE
jgi:hypothetical protein